MYSNVFDFNWCFLFFSECFLCCSFPRVFPQAGPKTKGEPSKRDVHTMCNKTQQTGKKERSRLAKGPRQKEQQTDEKGAQPSSSRELALNQLRGKRKRDCLRFLETGLRPRKCTMGPDLLTTTKTTRKNYDVNRDSTWARPGLVSVQA